VVGVFARRLVWPAIACLAAFVVLLALVNAGVLDHLDRSVWRQTYIHWHPRVARACYRITDLLSPQVDYAVLAVALVLLGRRGVPMKRLVAAGATAAAVAVVTYGVKFGMGRPGPPGIGDNAHGGSFPSGHTAATIVCYGTLALLVTVDRPARRARLLLGVAVLALLVMTALVYIASHWLSDTVGSALLAAGMLLLLAAWLSRRTASPSPATSH
jgi:membrane-associated phospholipid phosphatase